MKKEFKGLSGLSVRAANCLLRLKLNTRLRVVRALQGGWFRPENPKCLNLGKATYYEIGRWLSATVGKGGQASGKAQFAEWLMETQGLQAKGPLQTCGDRVLIIAVGELEAAAVHSFLADLEAGRPPQCHLLVPMMKVIAHAWATQPADAPDAMAGRPAAAKAMAGRPAAERRVKREPHHHHDSQKPH
jgi:hypothetical protein